MDKPRGFYEKSEVFDFLEKYMEEYIVDGPRIFKADNSSNSTVQKCQKTLHRMGKPTALHNVVSCFYRLC